MNWVDVYAPVLVDSFSDREVPAAPDAIYLAAKSFRGKVVMGDGTRNAAAGSVSTCWSP